MRWISFSILYALMVMVGCGASYVQEVVSEGGTVIELNSARFEFPDGAVTDSVGVLIEQYNIQKRTYGQGYKTTGSAFAIKPSNLALKKSIDFSMPVSSPNEILGAKIGEGFVPLANSYVDRETLYAQLHHPGEYYVIEKPAKFGIIGHSDVENALLVVTDPYISDYVRKLTDYLGQSGYSYPVWTYVYDIDKSIEENAFELRNELKQLHEQYGDFRLDAVSFGIGGLVFHRYVADTSIYQSDISSAVIAAGTPFLGSDLVLFENIGKSSSPYRYYFIDALADRAADILPESDLISWTKKHRYVVAGHYYDKIEENKNFASIRGRARFAGELPEERDGDGLVSLRSGLLTAIEPDPLPLDHFGLFEDPTARKCIVEFVKLYRTFNWPLVFSRVWRDKEPAVTIVNIWEKEARLHYGDVGLGVLLQWNENMLKSTPQNAILITNGDNDTYPAWYLQEKGIRDDVMIVNRNLLNLTEYAQYLEEHGLASGLSREQLAEIQHKKESGQIITKSDQLIELLIENAKRAVVFSTTVYEPKRYGYPLTLNGIVYKIGKGEVMVGDVYVDTEESKRLLHEVFNYDRYLSVDKESLSVDIQSIFANHSASLFTLSSALKQQGRYKEALEELEFGKQFVSEKYKHVFYYNEALLYIDMDANEQADSVLQFVLTLRGLETSTRKSIAGTYHTMGMTRKAIGILADCVKDAPEDKELLEILKKYQEEL